MGIFCLRLLGHSSSKKTRFNAAIFCWEEATDVEKDFATNPYWKYFTYDTFDPRTWVTLEDLETCLRTVKGGTVNTWVGADDLWEANILSLGFRFMTTKNTWGTFSRLF